MERRRLTLAHLALFRYVPLLVIVLTAVLWRALGPTLAALIGCALLALVAVALLALASKRTQRGDGRDDAGGGRPHRP